MRGLGGALSVGQREAVWRKTVESGNPELLVAREAGVVVGWIAFGACRDNDAPVSQAEVWAIYVAPGCWFQGVGRRLWQHARQRLTALGHDACSLWVLSENGPAIRFYETLGFVADNLPPKRFELGGRQLQEVRYIFRKEA